MTINYKVFKYYVKKLHIILQLLFFFHINYIYFKIHLCRHWIICEVYNTIIYNVVVISQSHVL